MRPFRLILPAIAALVLAKGAITYLEMPASDAGLGSLISAASAATDEAAAPVATPAPQVCEAPEELLALIRRERELLAAQKDRGAERSAEHDLASETLEIERQRLTDLKQELEGLLSRVAAAHTADVDRLVALYRNMKPKDAANIMNELDIEVSVMVMGTMDERDAAPILAALDPVRARAISQIILERSKLPGDQRLDDIRL
ncbi:MotE family protein [Marinovum sp. KMM 9879]